MPEVVTLRLETGIAHLRLNRPESANALDRTVAAALLQAAHEIAQSPSVGAVVLTGAGARFCGGGDLAAMLGADDKLDYVHQLASELDEAFRALSALEVPIVAGVHGAVAGAGLALMLSCDVVVAAKGTTFVPAYPAVGLTPDCGLSWLLSRAIGQQRALGFLLKNARVGTDEALSWGMVSEVASSDELQGRCDELSRALASGPAWALGQTKRLVRGSYEQTREQTGRLEADVVTAAAALDEAAQRMAKFLR